MQYMLQGYDSNAANSANPGLWKGLVGNWGSASSLNPTGSVLRDISGLDNHAALTNMDSSDWVRGHPRVGGYALDFDGANDHLVLAKPLTLTTFTFSAWVKRTDTGGFHNIFGGGSKTRLFSYNGSDDVALYADDNSPSVWVNALTSGVWHHLVLTYNNVEAELWIDGISQGTKNGTDKTFVIDYLAANQSANFEWDGLLSNLSFWDRSIVPNDIQLLFERPNALIELRTFHAITTVAAGPNTYNETMEGGVAVSGESPNTHVMGEIGEGGVSVGGEAPIARIMTEEVAQGGVVLSGEALDLATFTDVAQGGVVVSGIATEEHITASETYNETMDGGVVVSGEADEQHIKTYNETMDGGVIVAGEADEEHILSSNIYNETMDGGCVVSGEALDLGIFAEIMDGGCVVSGEALDLGIFAEVGEDGAVVSGEADEEHILSGAETYNETMDGGVVVFGEALDLGIFAEVGEDGAVVSGVAIEEYIKSTETYNETMEGGCNVGGKYSPFAINFDATDVLPYTAQDIDSVVEITNGGKQIRILGNAWKAIAHWYTLTADSRLEFFFKSTLEGEIQGIGFDTQLVEIAPTEIYQIYGSQTFGLQTHNDYVGSDWQHYLISPSFTGTYSYLTFIDDMDAAGDGEVIFSFVRLYETTDDPSNAQVIYNPESSGGAGLGGSATVSKTYPEIAEGGVTVNGSSTVSKTYPEIAEGGVTVNGSSVFYSIYTTLISGGVVVGGSVVTVAASIISQRFFVIGTQAQRFDVIGIQSQRFEVIGIQSQRFEAIGIQSSRFNPTGTQSQKHNVIGA